MRQKLLGWKAALRVSEMALGCGLIGATDAGVDPDTARRTLLCFAEAGGTLIDTSSAHQGGASERMIGEFIAEHGRDRFVVSTKYGRTPGGDRALLTGGCHPRAMMAQVEASLTRLRTDRIDLYSVEFPDGVTPVEEIVRGLDTLVRQGKVIGVGLSNFASWQVAHAATLADMRGWAPVCAIHHQYSLVERGAEREHLPMADAFGIGVLAWSPQARGRLAREGLSDVPAAVAEGLRAIAGERGVEAGTVALAWLLAKGVVPVVGARSPEQLRPSLAAADLALDEADVSMLDGTNGPAPYPSDLLTQLQASIGIGAEMRAAARGHP